jgi:hypothetical protein
MGSISSTSKEGREGGRKGGREEERKEGRIKILNILVEQ